MVEELFGEPGVRHRLAALALDSHVLRLKSMRALTQATRGDPAHKGLIRWLVDVDPLTI